MYVFVYTVRKEYCTEYGRIRCTPFLCTVLTVCTYVLCTHKIIEKKVIKRKNRNTLRCENHRECLLDDGDDDDDDGEVVVVVMVVGWVWVRARAAGPDWPSWSVLGWVGLG